MTKANKENLTASDGWLTVDATMDGHSQDPFFIEKNEETKCWLEQVGLPNMDKSRIDKMLVTKLDE